VATFVLDGGTQLYACSHDHFGIAQIVTEQLARRTNAIGNVGRCDAEICLPDCEADDRFFAFSGP